MRLAFASAGLATALSATLVALSACSTPPPRQPNENNNNNKGPQTCDVDGLDMVLPDEEATLPVGGELDRGCIGNPTVIAEGAPLTLEGCVDIFGLGGEAKRGIKVGLFRSTQDPKTATPEFGETDVAIADDSVGLECAGADANDPACLATDCSKNGYYRIDGVASNVPLIMKVYAVDDDTVIDTYTFDVVFYEVDATDGVYVYEANLIYRSTYDSIPTLAGKIVDGQQNIGDGQGRAVIAGEVHDCADRIVQGASITSSEYDTSSKITYFDGNTEDPKPDLRRLTTNTDGLYVLLNAATDAGTNQHTITAGMLDPDNEGQCISLSSRTIRTYPDSVSIVTVRGDLPQQP